MENNQIMAIAEKELNNLYSIYFANKNQEIAYHDAISKTYIKWSGKLPSFAKVDKVTEKTVISFFRAQTNKNRKMFHRDVSSHGVVKGEKKSKEKTIENSRQEISLALNKHLKGSELDLATRYILEGQSQIQIAVDLNISQPAISKRISRLVNKLNPFKDEFIPELIDENIFYDIFAEDVLTSISFSPNESALISGIEEKPLSNEEKIIKIRAKKTALISELESKKRPTLLSVALRSEKIKLKNHDLKNKLTNIKNNLNTCESNLKDFQARVKKILPIVGYDKNNLFFAIERSFLLAGKMKDRKDRVERENIIIGRYIFPEKTEKDIKPETGLKPVKKHYRHYRASALTLPDPETLKKIENLASGFTFFFAKEKSKRENKARVFRRSKAPSCIKWHNRKTA